VAAGVGDLVRSISGEWMVRPPTHCPAGHAFKPGSTLVGHQPCSCFGGHTTWTCECGATVYGPSLRDDCRVLAGRRRSAVAGVDDGSLNRPVILLGWRAEAVLRRRVHSVDGAVNQPRTSLATGSELLNWCLSVVWRVSGLNGGCGCRRSRRSRCSSARSRLGCRSARHVR
jgi:hypothetical protein